MQSRRSAPPFSKEQTETIVDQITTTEPVHHGLPGRGWTLKKIAAWLDKQFRSKPGRETVRRVMRAAGLRFKKFKKLLGKADPQKRAAYLEQFAKLYQAMCRGEITLIYIDEAHFHRDMDMGYTWGLVGERLWRVSNCPGLSERINWYGAYDFNRGQCLIWNEGACNGEHTVKFLKRIHEWQAPHAGRIVIIWDGAPCHRAKIVTQQAEALEMELIALPGYSPDLNPIEGLWKWMRQEVTQGHCHADMRDLFDACKSFIDHINADADAVIQRLWPPFEPDPEREKLLA